MQASSSSSSVSSLPNPCFILTDLRHGFQESLIVDFVPVKAPLPKGGEVDETPTFELRYDIMLAKVDQGDESKFQG
ncbi:hypothetical protein P7C70_g641, partial [Phenoliferia sp. Uapishka_3]